MEQMRLKDPYFACKKFMSEGHGEKLLVVSDDNEGNGYHGMFFALTPISSEDKECYDGLIFDSCEKDLSNLIIVG